MNTGRIVGLVRSAIGLLDTARREQRRAQRGVGRGPTPRKDEPKPAPGREPRPKHQGRQGRQERDEPRPTPGRGTTPAGSGRPEPAGAASTDTEMRGARIEYSPSLDGDADPGEVVWTWVPYEDDPSQGKDRPVMIFGRRGDLLVGVALTSKQKDHEAQVAVGTGSWDREGRPSYAKLERILDVDPAQVRREGAVLPKARFDDVVEALRRLHGLVERPR